MDISCLHAQRQPSFTWCVPRKRIACVILGLWLAAIVTTVPHWVSVSLSLYSLGDHTLNKAFDTLSSVLAVCWLLPLAIVPLMHFITLRKIRVHRQRMEKQVSPLSDDIIVIKEHLETQATDVDLPGQTVALKHHSESLGHVPGPSCTRDEENRIAPRHTIKNDSADELDDESRVHEAGTRKDIGVTCSQRCSSSSSRQDLQKGANLGKQGLAESEVRFLKMMFLMYTVLIISYVPFILYSTLVFDWDTVWKLTKFAYLIPVSSATMPYIFLWSNNNFRSAAAKMIATIYIRKVKIRQK